MSTSLIVSPHPDDETLGAAGYILKMKQQKNAVVWLNITDMSEEYGWPRERIAKRKEEIEEVCDRYQFDRFFNLALPPAQLESISLAEIISRVGEILDQIKPDMIVVPDENDIHTDHRIVARSISACLKTFRYPFIKRALAMEIVSETNYEGSSLFVPTFFCNISGYLRKKLDIANVYESEIQNHPFPRSLRAIEALALLRGSQCGCEYAEAFRVLKWIDD